MLIETFVRQPLFLLCNQSAGGTGRTIIRSDIGEPQIIRQYPRPVWLSNICTQNSFLCHHARFRGHERVHLDSDHACVGGRADLGRGRDRGEFFPPSRRLGCLSPRLTDNDLMLDLRLLRPASLSTLHSVSRLDHCSASPSAGRSVAAIRSSDRRPRAIHIISVGSALDHVCIVYLQCTY